MELYIFMRNLWQLALVGDSVEWTIIGAGTGSLATGVKALKWGVAETDGKYRAVGIAPAAAYDRDLVCMWTGVTHRLAENNVNTDQIYNRSAHTCSMITKRESVNL